MNRFDRSFDRLLVALAALAGAIFAAIALLIPVNVVLRNAFDTSIYGLLDAIEYGLLAATFLAAPWVLAKNAHVTVDLLVSSLRPGARRIADMAVNLMGAAVSAVFLWYALEALGLSYSRGSMIRTAFIIPEWWTLTVAPLSMALIFVEFLRKLARPASGQRAATGL
ncbi:TRAP transporter small permease [Rhizobiales bacterium]|uniref:TRAP transporter small permease n=1 Tax=Hongsoonwoonella zoysiae TaxID=2821844 RepID=UPI00155F6CC3|nr:TRAP transporter small permease [Hongsoonwoonella zoysiae]NRG17773.1 TRAP transporter small permease [Hongsoonwoonella zoysiae]